MVDETVERWKRLSEFPGYSVSSQGRVRNDEEGYLMTLRQNQSGLVHVGLTKGRVQIRRSVPLLVAKAFLPPPVPAEFDTPINVDGDRLNNSVDNLMWRPRWFAVKYHQQFNQERRGILRPIMDANTGKRYRTSWEAAKTFGLLDEAIAVAVANRREVWPTYQLFRIAH